MADLNTMIDPASGWHLDSANAINDSGQIVGTGKNKAGQAHAFLLTPVSERSPALLWGLATAALPGPRLAARKRRGPSVAPSLVATAWRVREGLCPRLVSTRQDWPASSLVLRAYFTYCLAAVSSPVGFIHSWFVRLCMATTAVAELDRQGRVVAVCGSSQRLRFGDW